jgi:excisionase family DNA binding protein
MPKTNPKRYTDPVRATRSIKESARLFGCGEPKVIELVENGTLKAVRIGNRTQPTVSSIEAVLGKPIEELERTLTNRAGTWQETTGTGRKPPPADHRPETSPPDKP